VDQSASVPLSTYECRILDRNLRVIRKIPLACTTYEQAKAAAADLFQRDEYTGELAGFGIWKNDRRLLIQLTQRPRRPRFAFEDHGH